MRDAQMRDGPRLPSGCTRCVWAAERRQAAALQSWWPVGFSAGLFLLVDGTEEHAASAADFHLPGFGSEGY
jgi:hypothetical protein